MVGTHIAARVHRAVGAWLAEADWAEDGPRLVRDAVGVENGAGVGRGKKVCLLLLLARGEQPGKIIAVAEPRAVKRLQHGRW